MLATLMRAGNVKPTVDVMHSKNEVEESQLTVLDATCRCLIMLRRGSGVAGSQPPLVIAHSLLGDARGYGRLWSMTIQDCDIFAVRHRGLSGGAAFTLDRAGAMSMAGEYGQALVAVFQSGPFDLIGASFGAVLASHVSCASTAAGGRPRRLVLDSWFQPLHMMSPSYREPNPILRRGQPHPTEAPTLARDEPMLRRAQPHLTVNPTPSYGGANPCT